MKISNIAQDHNRCASGQAPSSKETLVGWCFSSAQGSANKTLVGLVLVRPFTKHSRFHLKLE